MATTIRSSNQLYIDADLDLKSRKLTSVAAGTLDSDGVNKVQMDTAINNAVLGAGTSIHAPVADLTASKAIVSAGRADKMLMLIESLGLYHFDAESMAVSNDSTIIRPTDVASDAAAGRWVKMSSTLTDHDLLSNILGNGGYHLSLAERDKLTGIATGADVTSATKVGTSINGAAAKATPVDADAMPLLDSAASFGLKKFTFTNLKSFLKTYFDTIYGAALGYTPENAANEDASGGYAGLTLFKINFKNVAGSFTSFFTNSNTAARTYTFADRTGTIADDTDITGAKARASHTGTQLASTISDFAASALAAAPAETTTTAGTLIAGSASKTPPIDADSIAITDSAASNVLKRLTFANLKTYIFGLFTGDVTVNASGVTAIGTNKVTNAMLVQVATSTFRGRTTAGTGNVEDMTVAQAKALLGISTRVYRATPTGAVNGSNTAFTITTATAMVSGTESVFKNGLLMNAGAGNDYTISYGTTTTITFLTAPSNTPFTDTVLVDYSY
jgi:hypothetical protein